MPSVRLSFKIKKPNYFHMVFAHVFATTKHFFMIGFADLKLKTLCDKVMSLDLVFALHTLVKCSGSNEHNNSDTELALDILSQQFSLQTGKNQNSR